jgi:hypothetical protein
MRAQPQLGQGPATHFLICQIKPCVVRAAPAKVTPRPGQQSM